MSASVQTHADLVVPRGARQLARLRHFDLIGLVLTLITVVLAVLGRFRSNGVS